LSALNKLDGLGELLIPPQLVETFARGWAITRGVSAPVPDSGALRIDTGADDEAQRFVFSCLGDAIAPLGARIDAPRIRIKVPAEPGDVAALLPARWHVERTGTLMTADALSAGPTPSIPDDLRLRAEWRGGIFFVELTDMAGAEAARGRMAPIDGWALHDRVRVADLRQRRGLGTIVMTLLATEAHNSGLGRGLLAATVAGRALYQKLGWIARAPWTTAEIPVPPSP